MVKILVNCESLLSNVYKYLSLRWLLQPGGALLNRLERRVRGADNKVVIKQRVQQWGRAGDIELEHIKYLMLVRNTRLYNLMNIGDQSRGVQ